MTATFGDATEQAIAAWHGIVPPNEPGRRMAADLASVIAAFEAVRGQMQFEDEPASFEAALRATMDPAAVANPAA